MEGEVAVEARGKLESTDVIASLVTRLLSHEGGQLCDSSLGPFGFPTCATLAAVAGSALSSIW